MGLTIKIHIDTKIIQNPNLFLFHQAIQNRILVRLLRHEF